MIKTLKAEIPQLAAHETGHMVLLTLFDVVDDTVLVNKSVFSELAPTAHELATHKFGRIPLLYPIVGRKTRLLSPQSIALLQKMDAIREVTRYIPLPDPEAKY